MWVMIQQGAKFTPRVHAIRTLGMCIIGVFGVIFYSFVIPLEIAVVFSWILVAVGGIFIVLPIFNKGIIERWAEKAKNSKSHRFETFTVIVGTLFLLWYAFDWTDPDNQVLLMFGILSVYSGIVDLLVWYRIRRTSTRSDKTQNVSSRLATESP